MEGGKRGEEGWKGEGGERRDGRGRVGKEGKQWKEREGERWREEEWCGVLEGGDREAPSPGLIVARFRSFRFHPCAVVFFRRVVSVFIHGRLSSFMGRVHVLGVRHSCGGVVVVCVVVCGHHVVVCGHRVVVRGWKGSFVGGVRRSWLGA